MSENTLDMVVDILKANNDAVCYTGLFMTSSLLYWLYLKKYKYYIFLQKDDVSDIRAEQPRGKCPPFFPNGWYSIMNGDELKPNDVRYFDYCGRHIVLFRGTDDNVYCLNAFCAHMGANLGKFNVMTSIFDYITNVFKKIFRLIYQI